ncbi:hypothetical protein LUZ60_015305 [Juncus effusus]|nr:hypothetical protein LUZ60_015305 [Juncus effusus]
MTCVIESLSLHFSLSLSRDSNVSLKDLLPPLSLSLINPNEKKVENETTLSLSLSHESRPKPEMPSPLRNGTNNHQHRNQFVSTVSERKIRRVNCLLLLFRLAAFSFSLAAAVFTVSNSSRSSGSSPSWLDFLSFRFLFAANAIVTVYSLFELSAAIWEIIKGPTLLPESIQLWFDFAHDQVFTYMLLSAGVSASMDASKLKQGPTCQGNGNSFCIQAYISVGLCFAGFLFLALSCLASGFRLVCFVATGSRFPV